MKLPNKLFSVNESCIGKFPIILNILMKESVSVLKLYQMTRKHFLSIGDFVETLDALFYLKKIDLNEDSEVLVYVA